MKTKMKWYSLRKRTLLIMPIIALFLFIIAVGKFSLLTYFITPGEGPAGPQVSPEYFKEIWTDKKVMLIGVGDSITDGFGASRGQGYFDLLIKNKDKDYPDMNGLDLSRVLNDLTAENFSVSTSDTIDHLNQIKRIPVYSNEIFGVIVITSGGNDLIHNYGKSAPKDAAMYGCSFEQGKEWTKQTQQRIRAVLSGIMVKFPGGCEIFLANIYDPTDGVSDPQNIGLPAWPEGSRILAVMNNLILELCDEFENVHMVDIHSEFLGHGIHCRDFWRKHYRKDDPHFWYFYNLEDPNPRGYDAIRRLYLLKMIEVLPERLRLIN